MTAPLPVSLPYGIRDVKLTPYVDALGTILGGVSVDLPFMQTFSFSDAEEFQELRGDDKKVTTHGQGANVSWTLESGGISLAAWKILTGGTLVESGLTPNRSIRLRKRGTDSRPYFKVEGQSISDAGGDLHCIVYRCKTSGDMQGDFADGAFFVTNASGEGLPLVDDTNDLLYDFIQNESKVAVSLTPSANPLPTPQNVVVGAKSGTSPNITQVISWDPVVGATGYKVEQAASPFSTWSAATGGTVSTNTATITGLSTGSYQFRVKATIGGVDSDPSTPTGVVTV